MKKIVLLWLPVLGILVLSGCKTPDPTAQDPLLGYATYVVRSGILEETQHWVGTVEPVQEVTITPEVGGRITDFVVDIGSVVAAEDLLLKIDSDESATQWAAANSMVSALTSVKANTARVFDEQINAMEHQLQQAQRQTEIAKTAASGENTGQDDTLRVLEQQKITANKSVANLEQLYATKELSIISNTEDALNQAYILTVEVLDYTDKILGVSTLNEKENDAFESKLSAKNTSLKREARQNWRTLDSEKELLEQKFDQVRRLLKTIDLLNGTGKSEVISLLDEAIDYMKNLELFLKWMQDVLDNTTSGPSLSEQQISQYAQNISTFQNQINAVLLTAEGDNLLWLKWSKQMIDGIQAQYDLDITKAYEDIKTLEAQISATSHGTDTKTSIANQQVIAANTAYKAMENQLASLKQEKSAKLSEIEAQIAQTRGQASQARVMADNATIKAPFDGVVMERYVDQGAVVGPGIPLLKLGDTSKKIIAVRVPEQYRVGLSLGQEAHGEVNGKAVELIIDQIAPSADSLSKTVLVKYYLVTDEDIPLGAQAKVYVDTNWQKNISNVTVPRSFIRYQYGDAYVWIWNKTDEKSYQQFITLGDCSQAMCEVTSGLKEGEKIVKI